MILAGSLPLQSAELPPNHIHLHQDFHPLLHIVAIFISQLLLIESVTAADFRGAEQLYLSTAQKNFCVH